MESLNPTNSTPSVPSYLNPHLTSSVENPLSKLFVEITALSNEMNQHIDRLNQSITSIESDLNELEVPLMNTTNKVQNVVLDKLPTSGVVNVVKEASKKKSRKTPEVNPTEPNAKKQKSQDSLSYSSYNQFLISKINEQFDSAMRDHYNIFEIPQGFTTLFLSQNNSTPEFALKLQAEILKHPFGQNNSFYNFFIQMIVNKKLVSSTKIQITSSKFSTIKIYRSLGEQGGSCIGDPFITTYIENRLTQVSTLRLIGTSEKSLRAQAYKDILFSMEVETEGKKINYYNLNIITLEVMSNLIIGRVFNDFPNYDKNELLLLTKPAFSMDSWGVRTDFIPFQRYITYFLGKSNYCRKYESNLRLLSSFIVPAFIENFVTSRKAAEASSGYSPPSNEIHAFMTKIERFIKFEMDVDCPELRENLVYLLELYTRIHPIKKCILDKYLIKLSDNSIPNPESNRLYREVHVLLKKLPKTIPEYKGFLQVTPVGN